MHPLVTEKSPIGFNITIKLYHGTNSKFDKFNKDMAGSNTGYQDADNAFYLTANPMLAENYAIGAVGRNGGNRTILEFYISINNPKIYNRATDFYRDLDGHTENGSSLIEELKKDGMDSIIVREDMEEVVVFDSSNIKPCSNFTLDSKKEPKAERINLLNRKGKNEFEPSF